MGNVQIANRFFFSSFNNYLMFAGVGVAVSTLKGTLKIFIHLHRYPPSLARASTLSRARLFAISCKTKYKQMSVV